MRMDGAQLGLDIGRLFVDLIKAVAWPAAVVILVMAFRKPLHNLLPRLRKASGYGWLFEWAEEVRQVAEESAELPDLESAPESAERSGDGAPPRESGAEGEGVMLAAWRQLEQASVDAAARAGLSYKGRNIGIIFEQLGERGLVSDHAQTVARTLQKLRNVMVHHGLTYSGGAENNFVTAVSNLERVVRGVPAAGEEPR